MKVLMNLPVAPSNDVMIEREGSLLRVYFGFQKEEVKDMDGNVDETVSQFSCQNVDVKGVHNYGHIVGAIMDDRYSSDDVQAIMFNRELAVDAESEITEEKRAEYLEEYRALQAYRVLAKEVANKVINLL